HERLELTALTVGSPSLHQQRDQKHGNRHRIPPHLPPPSPAVPSGVCAQLQRVTLWGDEVFVNRGMPRALGGRLLNIYMVVMTAAGSHDPRSAPRQRPLRDSASAQPRISDLPFAICSALKNFSSPTRRIG